MEVDRRRIKGSGTGAVSHFYPRACPCLSIDTLLQSWLNWLVMSEFYLRWQVDDKPCGVSHAAILGLSRSVLRYCPWRTFAGLMSCSTSPSSAGHWSEMLQRRYHAFRRPLAKSSAAVSFLLKSWGFWLIFLTCVPYLVSGLQRRKQSRRLLAQVSRSVLLGLQLY